MKSAPSILAQSRMLALALFATAGLSLLAGCKGNTTSAALPTRHIGAPPRVLAHAVGSELQIGDPLSSELWRNAVWSPLIAPANTTRTTAPSRAAVLFDAQTLYIAFINTRQPAPEISLRDLVSLYLDTTAAGDGRELLKVVVEPTGHSSCTWIRSASPPTQRPDGSPDLGHPISTIPNMAIAGLSTHVGEGTFDGAPVWTAVVAIPLKNLPTPLSASAAPGTHWKLNLVRSVLTDWGTPRAEQLQANLSPVYVGAQELSPYRMAELDLVP